MKKNPILQISFNNLNKVLLESFKNYCSGNFDDFYNDVVMNAIELSERKFIYVSQKTKKRLDKFSVNVNMFNTILEQERINNKHYSVRLISRKDKLYTTLENIVNNAEYFCSTFNLKSYLGFREYIKYGLHIIGKNYRLNKFITYHDNIMQKYERDLSIKNDVNTELTYKVFEYYVVNKLNFNETLIINTWENYAHDFVYCTEEIVKNNIDYKDWIDSQFKGFEYLDVPPQPYQLHGVNAIKRVMQYIKTKKVVNNDNWREKVKRNKKF